MTLVHLGQLDITYPFLQAGNLQMSQLQFYIAGATLTIIRTNAIMLASSIDDQFTALCGATYAGAATRQTAITRMQAILVRDDNIVSNLSDTINQLYVFPA
ncbi:hypothetical protein [Hufsiella ginkgonis]|uniref:Uncharacterized protein n=1 Tax=Hufsiella ginkgonis TaxID=2695274 RepID=A0A7K1XT14_9SPHI|nr:hypothetical protein [Hufsiella ginkgonis]MXV14092.1 hypothetical protein [Hufsiella ginkgonis]